MASRVVIEPGIESGLNSDVECDGQLYHVQTQCSTRGAPVIESLAYQGGQMLVRITASYDDMARSLGFNGDDGRHLLELQHADLVRKIRHGMLREDRPAEPAPDAAPRFVDASGAYVDPAGIDDPGVRELLNDLGAKIDEARHPESARRAAPPGPAPGRTARPRWRRVVVRIRLPF